jgi:hypothetical protein
MEQGNWKTLIQEKMGQVDVDRGHQGRISGSKPSNLGSPKSNGARDDRDRNILLNEYYLVPICIDEVVPTAQSSQGVSYKKFKPSFLPNIMFLLMSFES